MKFLDENQKTVKRNTFSLVPYMYSVELSDAFQCNRTRKWKLWNTWYPPGIQRNSRVSLSVTEPGN